MMHTFNSSRLTAVRKHIQDSVIFFCNVYLFFHKYLLSPHLIPAPPPIQYITVVRLLEMKIIHTAIEVTAIGVSNPLTSFPNKLAQARAWSPQATG